MLPGYSIFGFEGIKRGIVPFEGRVRTTNKMDPGLNPGRTGWEIEVQLDVIVLLHTNNESSPALSRGPAFLDSQSSTTLTVYVPP
jgi:hypothetical protein